MKFKFGIILQISRNQLKKGVNVSGIPRGKSYHVKVTAIII